LRKHIIKEEKSEIKILKAFKVKLLIWLALKIFQREIRIIERKEVK
jgi:hypothetical protein